jgi:hypothetical protein
MHKPFLSSDHPSFHQAKKQERLAQDLRDQAEIDRLQAGGEVDELEDDKKVVLKRSGSEEVKVKVESKRCKVTVKEEQDEDGKMVLEIQDD